MATSFADSAGEDITLCSICVEKFKTPRYLPCMHSFCHKCLSSYIVSVCRSTEPRLGFNCPLCREYVPNNGAFDKPEEWAENFPVNDILERIIEKPDERLCAACLRDNETENATGFCLCCMEYLCTMCTKHHKKHLLSRSHTICQIDEIKSRKILPELGKYFRCPDHNETTKLFCNDHEQPCCSVCTGACEMKHRKCQNIETVHNAALSVKESGKLDDLLNEVKNIEKKLTDAKQEQEKNNAELEDFEDEMTNQTEREFKNLVEHIGKLKYKHLEEIAVVFKRGKEKMKQCTTTINDGIKCAKYCCRNIGKARKTGNENQVLMNYYTAKEKVAQLKQFNFTKKQINISEKKAEILKEIMDMKLLADIEYSESELHVRFDVRAIELLLISELSIEGRNLYTGAFLENGTFASIDHAVDGKCFIYDKTWTQINVIEGLHLPFEVLQNADELFVTCTGTESVEVFSASDFQKLRSIPMNEPVYGITIRDGVFYVACATKIIKTDIVGNKIREYEAEGVNNICIVTTNDGLIVYSNWVLHAVTAITENGDIAWTYKSVHLREPNELDTDSFGNIFVPAKKSNNIHVLTGAGELIRVFEGMANPVFIKINEKRDICCICSNRRVTKVYRL